MRLYTLSAMTSMSRTILLIGILQVATSATTVLAHPVMPQSRPNQVSPDFSQLMDYLSMLAEDPEILGPVNPVPNFNIPEPSPESDLLPAAPIELIPDIASMSETEDFLPFVGPPTLSVSGTTEASSYTSSTTFSTSNVTSAPTQTTNSMSASTSDNATDPPHFGPGLVAHPTASVSTESDNSVYTATTASTPLKTSKSEPFIAHESGTAAPETSHRAPIMVGSVISGLVAFSMITCVLLNTKRLRGVLFARGVHTDLDSRVIEDEDKFSAETNLKGEIQSDPNQLVSPALPAWMKLPSQISPFHNHRDSLLSYFRLARDSVIGQSSRLQPQKIQKAKILDIVSDFPRSRFSVTSSDYTHSLRSTDSNHHLDHAVVTPRSVPLLTPEEFFSLPSSTTFTSRHSRTGSAPVFGRHWREDRLNSLSRVQGLQEEEKLDKRSNARSRALSMAVAQNRNAQRRRTQSIAIVENGIRS